MCLRQLGGDHLHDISNLVQVLAGVIGTVATAMAVFHKTNRADYSALLKEKDAIIAELKTEKGEFKQYYYAERERRIKAEEQLADLKDKYDNLKSKLKKAKEHQSNDD